MFESAEIPKENWQGRKNPAVDKEGGGKFPIVFSKEYYSVKMGPLGPYFL